MKKIICLFLSVTLLASFSGCLTQRVSVKQFHKQSPESILKLRGIAVKKLFLLRVFMAAFYLPPDTKTEDALSDIPKDLQVHYYVRIPSSTLNQFTIDRMKANLSPQEFKAVQISFDQMKKCFPDINSGDILSLSYLPGTGTRFIYNGKLRGVIEGKDFAKAIFATWIGPQPFDPVLKNQILGISK